jgi:hypothetical protein
VVIDLLACESYISGDMSPYGHVHSYSNILLAQPYFFRVSSRRESDFARLRRLLREADERAEHTRRRAKDEQRSRKEADEHRAEQE